MQEHIAPTWTLSQLYGLAPDRFALKNGRDQANSPNWLTQHKHGDLLWGSHRRQQASLPPYRIIISLSNLQTHCSCGSLKNPCKFTIALLLRHHQSPDLFTTPQTIPDWVTEWKTASQTAKPPPPHTATDQEVQKIDMMKEGMEEFALWLRDLIHHGLGSIPDKANELFTPMIHRLYDSRATETAHELKQVQQKIFPSRKKPAVDWAEQLLAELGRFYLLTQAWGRYDSLNTAEQIDLRLAVGLAEFNLTQLNTHKEHSQWRVLGKRFEVIGKQRVRRTWLQGVKDGRIGLLTDHIHGRHSHDQQYATDSLLTGTFHFYPSTQQNSGQLSLEQMGNSPVNKNRHPEKGAYTTITDAQNRFHKLQTSNPWLKRIPIVWRNSYIRYDEESWWLADHNGRAIPLKAGQRRDWHLLAHNGGRALTLFGELYATGFEPLSIYDALENRWLDLSIWGSVKP